MGQQKKFINSPQSVVYELIEGLVACHPHLKRLDGFPDIKVVFEAEHDPQKVALISGGGSGHEPAHAGYVGGGMLTAAVCGDVFASPSTAAVLAAIRKVTGRAGCLLIIKNYTGDRLNFGLAAEQARSEGYTVEVVVVGEDAAIEQPGLAGRRGLAGTVFVHKLAGAAAAAGLPLQDVARVAREAASAMVTLGTAFTVCTLPGQEVSDRLSAGEMEVGLGIHGEPGTLKAPVQPADEIISLMLDKMLGFQGMVEGLPRAGSHAALLVNNLGGTPPMEVYIAARGALTLLEQKHQVTVDRVYVGPFMTSLDMAGVSLTLMATTDERLRLLDAPATAPGWPASSALRVAGKAPAAVPTAPTSAAAAGEVFERPSQLSAQGAFLEAALKLAAESLIAGEPLLTDYDKQAGDGDCGDTMSRAAGAILAATTTSYPLNSPADTASALASTVGNTVGGTSGVLYCLMFTAAARHLRGEGSMGVGVGAYVAALAKGIDAVVEFGGAREGCRTMLDALCPAVRAAQAAVQEGKGPADVAVAAAAAAKEGAQNTCGMVALAGRASYVGEAVKKLEVPDPGAAAVAMWMEAVASAFQL